MPGSEEWFQTLVAVRGGTCERREASSVVFAFLSLKCIKILNEILCENVNHITKKYVKSTSSESYKGLEDEAST